TAAAERLRAAGHTVHVPDRYEGHAAFDTYEDAMAFAHAIGYPEMLRRAEAAVAGLPSDLVFVGWSAGGAVAEHLALNRRATRGVVLISAAAKLSWFGASAWPNRVPVQIHYATNDEFREEDELQGFMTAVRNSGAALTLHEYRLRGHLFDDPSQVDEYNEAAAEVMWTRVLDFVAGCDPNR
ncbi:MAG: alpha/beta fold hydrolase, partial [Acetobacteraceae bacterium]|nr:alpha/beta fold hydrolase [Acetobacteraceae bacterium]